MLLTLLFLLPGIRPLNAQQELLPLHHPLTELLLRIHRYGKLQDFPAEHLPISNHAAHRFLEEALSDSDLPASMRREAEWLRDAAAAADGEIEYRTVIPTSTNNASVLDSATGTAPWAGVVYRHPASQSRVILDPVLDGDMRVDLKRSKAALIMQGGVELRGTILNHVGFLARATNGTVIGDDTVARSDPRLSHSFKFGRTALNRDIDFGSGHLRADFDNVAIEIGRDRVLLGLGGERNLLFSGELPSFTDNIRMQLQFGPFAFTHLHASLIDNTNNSAVGVNAFIPEKYVAAHLLSFGPIARTRFSVGESVIYSNRPFQIGYLNPFNFLKSQEHYLRDRDNTFMYAAVASNPVNGLRLEGEFMLDDLIFSNIGTGYWGNKTAWRLSADLLGRPFDAVDLGLSYTRLEPYVYSHFNRFNAYTHDGTPLAASGLEPNSHLLQGSVRFYPTARLRTSLTAAFTEHGANPVDSGGNILRNVGGDITGTYDSLSSFTVTFLDGDLEKTTSLRLQIDYEILRNVSLRMIGVYTFFDLDRTGLRSERTELQVGMHVGAW